MKTFFLELNSNNYTCLFYKQLLIVLDTETPPIIDGKDVRITGLAWMGWLEKLFKGMLIAVKKIESYIFLIDLQLTLKYKTAYYFLIV